MCGGRGKQCRQWFARHLLSGCMQPCLRTDQPGRDARKEGWCGRPNAGIAACWPVRWNVGTRARSMQGRSGKGSKGNQRHHLRTARKAYDNETRTGTRKLGAPAADANRGATRLLLMQTRRKKGKKCAKRTTQSCYVRKLAVNGAQLRLTQSVRQDSKCWQPGRASSHWCATGSCHVCAPPRKTRRDPPCEAQET